ncbi:PREDICTED: uncharacterized protein LOC105557394 [Vollenhovia emeryi]|uniref:uncharacterized protein LOC105557394 n=1 Tax=Vollenhovia emeryi TaxID=411798 RepID=UPI0005F3786D|nr:PREDICTED: uncharacterized protein LOC105557394 [Vollenhovia emeryi]
MTLRCYVKHCKKNNKDNKDVSFFQQPKNPELRKKWQEFANVQGDPPNHLRICSDHFESNCIRKKYPRPLLVHGAIPTIKTHHKSSFATVIKCPEDKVEIYRPALEGNCFHPSKRGIVVDIQKSTAEQPAIITIETNDNIKIVLSDEEEDERHVAEINPSFSPSTIPMSIELVPIASSTLIEKNTSTFSTESFEVSEVFTPTQIFNDTLIQLPEQDSDLRTPAIHLESASPSASITLTPRKISTNHIHSNSHSPSVRITFTPTKTSSSLTPKPSKLFTPKASLDLTPKSLRLNAQKRTIKALRSKIYRLQRDKRKTIPQKSVEIEKIITQSARYLSKTAQTLFATHLRLSCVKNHEKDIATSLKISHCLFCTIRQKLIDF